METRPSPAPIEARSKTLPTSPIGGFIELEGEPWYRISAFHCMDPFLMTVAGDADLWMFIASGGGLTAGRIDADGSLFPYVTVDQLHDAHHHAGPLTLLRVERKSGDSVLWEPFAEAEAKNPFVERNLYKNVPANRLVFEEIRHDLRMAFRYRWSGCDEFGWVRSATLQNRGPSTVRLTLLDGLRNVLPYGAPLSLYQHASNLVDAYKRTELDRKTGLGIFALNARITDRAEALEVLRANTVWCCGLEHFRVHLSLPAVDAFRAGRPLVQEEVLRGVRGNYLVSGRLELEQGESSRWHIVADAGQDHLRIARLRRRIRQEPNLADRIEASLRRATERLRRNVASADGLQLSGHPETDGHHFANVLFNCMRGGVFLRNHELPIADFLEFLRVRSPAVAQRHRFRLADLPAMATVDEIVRVARDSGDLDFERLAYEYLPLHFGRRHGDPSRPWNRFSIRARDREGRPELNYEGNWRDIFQNWEALGSAFPRFLPSLVARFVNASTVDGFNPYRITREGVDWETVSDEDPWANIGYWGDHQIVYLLRLLEAMHRYDPTALRAMLGREIFSYAEVPYRIKPYEQLLADPHSTIEFDSARAARIQRRVRNQGTDGKLSRHRDGSVYHANLLEKLLVPALAKLSNLIPDAGIWMNTQRPEWNDANNALAAGGVSVVTLCYLRRYLSFLADRLTTAAEKEFSISREIADWFEQIQRTLEEERGMLTANALDAAERKRLMDRLGGAFSDYRQAVYSGGFSGRAKLSVRRALDLCRIGLEFLDWGIAANRRRDGLFHTYNVLNVADDGSGVRIGRLPVMLEGQVAVLNSGFLQPRQALEVLERLFDSDLYRPREKSFILYPEEEPPGFLDKNVVPESRVEAIPLLRDLLAKGDPSLIVRDADGIHRFQGDLRNAVDVAALLDRLGEREPWRTAVDRDRGAILELFEDVFHHNSYRGRSGVMYAYEGIGCIYWHMVAKLLLATQEQARQTSRVELPEDLQRDLARMYYRIRSGLGYEKTVADYGAFPTDPYSHTPHQGGAKQPGMSGQVKEEILTRSGELGILVEEGRLRFEPTLLRSGELLRRPEDFRYYDVQGEARSIALSPGSLAFTVCQVPVVYERVSGQAQIRVVFTNGSSVSEQGNGLDASCSKELFSRSGRIERIEVSVPNRQFSRF